MSRSKYKKPILYITDESENGSFGHKKYKKAQEESNDKLLPLISVEECCNQCFNDNHFSKINPIDSFVTTDNCEHCYRLYPNMSCSDSIETFPTTCNDERSILKELKLMISSEIVKDNKNIKDVGTITQSGIKITSLMYTKISKFLNKNKKLCFGYNLTAKKEKLCNKRLDEISIGSGFGNYKITLKDVGLIIDLLLGNIKDNQVNCIIALDTSCNGNIDLLDVRKILSKILGIKNNDTESINSKEQVCCEWECVSSTSTTFRECQSLIESGEYICSSTIPDEDDGGIVPTLPTGFVNFNSGDPLQNYNQGGPIIMENWTSFEGVDDVGTCQCGWFKMVSNNHSGPPWTNPALVCQEERPTGGPWNNAPEFNPTECLDCGVFSVNGFGGTVEYDGQCFHRNFSYDHPAGTPSDSDHYCSSIDDPKWLNGECCLGVTEEYIETIPNDVSVAAMCYDCLYRDTDWTLAGACSCKYGPGVDETPFDIDDTSNYCGAGNPSEGPGNQFVGSGLSAECVCDAPDFGEVPCALYYDSLDGCLDAPVILGCTDPTNANWCGVCYDADLNLVDCNTACLDAGYSGCEVSQGDDLGCPNQLDDTLCWSPGCMFYCKDGTEYNGSTLGMGDTQYVHDCRIYTETILEGMNCAIDNCSLITQSYTHNWCPCPGTNVSEQDLQDAGFGGTELTSAYNEGDCNYCTTAFCDYHIESSCVHKRNYIWFQDSDGDGLGCENVTKYDCNQTTGWVTCDDNPLSCLESGAACDCDFNTHVLDVCGECYPIGEDPPNRCVGCISGANACGESENWPAIDGDNATPTYEPCICNPNAAHPTLNILGGTYGNVCTDPNGVPIVCQFDGTDFNESTACEQRFYHPNHICACNSNETYRRFKNLDGDENGSGCPSNTVENFEDVSGCERWDFQEKKDCCPAESYIDMPSDGSTVYYCPNQGNPSSGALWVTCNNIVDCDGINGGSGECCLDDLNDDCPLEIDECNICGGNNLTDCTGTCLNYTDEAAYTDTCGLCICPEEHLYYNDSDICEYTEEDANLVDDCGVCSTDDDYGLLECQGCKDPNAENYCPPDRCTDWKNEPYGGCIYKGCLDLSTDNTTDCGMNDYDYDSGTIPSSNYSTQYGACNYGVAILDGEILTNDNGSWPYLSPYDGVEVFPSENCQFEGCCNYPRCLYYDGDGDGLGCPVFYDGLFPIVQCVDDYYYYSDTDYGSYGNIESYLPYVVNASEAVDFNGEFFINNCSCSTNQYDECGVCWGNNEESWNSTCGGNCFDPFATNDVYDDEGLWETDVLTCQQSGWLMTHFIKFGYRCPTAPYTSSGPPGGQPGWVDCNNEYFTRLVDAYDTGNFSCCRYQGTCGCTLSNDTECPSLIETHGITEDWAYGDCGTLGIIPGSDPPCSCHVSCESDPNVDCCVDFTAVCYGCRSEYGGDSFEPMATYDEANACNFDVQSLLPGDNIDVDANIVYLGRSVDFVKFKVVSLIRGIVTKDTEEVLVNPVSVGNGVYNFKLALTITESGYENNQSGVVLNDSIFNPYGDISAWQDLSCYGWLYPPIEKYSFDLNQQNPYPTDYRIYLEAFSYESGDINTPIFTFLQGSYVEGFEGAYKLSIDGSAPALCSPTVNDDNNCSGWHIPFVKNTAPFANAGFNRYVLLNQPFVLSGANSFDLGYGSCDVDQTTENLLYQWQLWDNGDWLPLTTLSPSHKTFTVGTVLYDDENGNGQVDDGELKCGIADGFDIECTTDLITQERELKFRLYVEDVGYGENIQPMWDSDEVVINMARVLPLTSKISGPPKFKDGEGNIRTASSKIYKSNISKVGKNSRWEEEELRSFERIGVPRESMLNENPMRYSKNIVRDTRETSGWNELGCSRTGYVNSHYGCYEWVEDDGVYEAFLTKCKACSCFEYDDDGYCDDFNYEDISCCVGGGSSNWPYVWYNTYESVINQFGGNDKSYVHTNLQIDEEFKGDLPPLECNEEHCYLDYVWDNTETSSPYEMPIIGIFSGPALMNGEPNPNHLCVEGNDCAIRAVMPTFVDNPPFVYSDSGTPQYWYVEQEIYPENPHIGYMCENSFNEDFENVYGDPMNRICMPCEHPDNDECSQSDCGSPTCSNHCVDEDGDIIDGNNCFNQWPTVWNKNNVDPTGEAQFYTPLKFQYMIDQDFEFYTDEDVADDPNGEGLPINWDELYLLKTDHSYYPVATNCSGCNTDNQPMYDFPLGIFHTGIGVETFTIRVYDPSDDTIYIVGEYTIDGGGGGNAANSLGTALDPHLISFEKESCTCVQVNGVDICHSCGGVVGCMEPTSCDYNEQATENDPAMCRFLYTPEQTGYHLSTCGDCLPKTEFGMNPWDGGKVCSKTGTECEVIFSVCGDEADDICIADVPDVRLTFYDDGDCDSRVCSTMETYKCCWNDSNCIDNMSNECPNID